MLKNKKLIIWDFDGVIGDTEVYWVQLWYNLLIERYNIDWDFSYAYKVLAGISPKSKMEKLIDLNIKVDKEFLEEISHRIFSKMDGNISKTIGIEKILSDKSIIQCIGTGGTTKNTFKKIEVLNLQEFFNKENTFTAEMVRYGKPEPDLFLYCAEQMGFEPKDCVVVEDSIAGMYAAIKAKMDLVAYTEHQPLNKKNFIKEIKQLGVINIADNINELMDIFYKK